MAKGDSRRVRVRSRRREPCMWRPSSTRAGSAASNANCTHEVGTSPATSGASSGGWSLTGATCGSRSRASPPIVTAGLRGSHDQRDRRGPVPIARWDPGSPPGSRISKIQHRRRSGGSGGRSSSLGCRWCEGGRGGRPATCGRWWEACGRGRVRLVRPAGRSVPAVELDPAAERVDVGGPRRGSAGVGVRRLVGGDRVVG